MSFNIMLLKRYLPDTKSIRGISWCTETTERKHAQVFALRSSEKIVVTSCVREMNLSRVLASRDS